MKNEKLKVKSAKPQCKAKKYMKTQKEKLKAKSVKPQCKAKSFKF